MDERTDELDGGMHGLGGTIGKAKSKGPFFFLFPLGGCAWHARLRLAAQPAPIRKGAGVALPSLLSWFVKGCRAA